MGNLAPDLPPSPLSGPGSGPGARGPNGGRLTWLQRAGFGSGDFGLNLFWQGAGLYLIFFYTDVVGLPNTVAGLVFAVGAVWDAASDPAMGLIAERSASRFGKYRPYLLFGAVPLALSFVFLFAAPAMAPPAMLAASAFLAQIAFKTLYTLVSIPYSSLSAQITRDSEERSILAGVRMACAFLGGMVIVAVAGLLQRVHDDRAAFLWMSAVAGAVGAATLIGCALALRERDAAASGAPGAPGTPHEAARLDIGELAASIAANRPFLLLCAAISAIAFALTLFEKSILYFFDHRLGDRDAGNLALFVMTGAQFVSIPLWTLAALKASKRVVWIAGNMLAAAGLLAFFLNDAGATGYYVATIAVIAFGLGAHAVTLWAMAPDTVEYGQWRTGVRHEGALIGVLSFVQKAALALGALAFGVMLDVIGYEAGRPQSDAMLDGLHGAMTLIPAAGFALSILLIARYPITRETHRRIRRELGED